MSSFQFPSWDAATDSMLSTWTEQILEHDGIANPEDAYENWAYICECIDRDMEEWNGDLAPYLEDEEQLRSFARSLKEDLRPFFFAWLAQYANGFDEDSRDDYVEYIEDFWGDDPPARDTFTAWLNRIRQYRPTTASRMERLSAAWYRPKPAALHRLPYGRSITGDELDACRDDLAHLLHDYTERVLKSDLRKLLSKEREEGAFVLDHTIMEPASLYKLIDAAQTLTAHLTECKLDSLKERAAAGDQAAADLLKDLL